MRGRTALWPGGVLKTRTEACGAPHLSRHPVRCRRDWLLKEDVAQCPEQRSPQHTRVCHESPAPAQATTSLPKVHVRPQYPGEGQEVPSWRQPAPQAG